MERFFGGHPLMVLLRLAIISIIAGVALHALGLSPIDLVNSIERLFRHIYNLGFEAIEWGFRYLVTGAVIVVPIWLIYRLIKMFTGASSERRSSDG